jgi:hypothetical protein
MTPANLAEVVAAARAAARRRSATWRVRYVDSIGVPDETCLHGVPVVAAPFSGSGDFQCSDLLSFAGVDPRASAGRSVVRTPERREQR